MRAYEQQGALEESHAAAKRAPALSKYAHAVIFVVKANDPRLTDGKYKNTLQKIREHFREDGNNHIHQNSSFRPLIAKIIPTVASMTITVAD